MPARRQPQNPKQNESECSKQSKAHARQNGRMAAKSEIPTGGAIEPRAQSRSVKRKTKKQQQTNKPRMPATAGSTREKHEGKCSSNPDHTHTRQNGQVTANPKTIHTRAPAASNLKA
jgi:hypothetical protein